MKKSRISNPERSEATRTALLDAARRLFVEHGYADTATPDIVAAAGVTRGALYHHYEDKMALFHAVVRREAGRVASEIEAATLEDRPPLESLKAGAAAYFAAMEKPGRTRLLLLDGVAILGLARMAEIDRETGARTLREGFTAAMALQVDPEQIGALADLISAAFDRAVLAIEGGGNALIYRAAVLDLVERAVTPS